VFLVAVELHDLLLQDSPLLSPLSINSSHHPYCLVVSVTATATWLCYGLDGSEHNATHFAELPPPPTSTSAFSNVPSSASDLPGSKPSRPLSSSAHRSQTQDGTHWPPGACTELNLPPSRSAMMLRTVEQQEQHKKLQPQRQQQQQQQKRELPSHRDDMKAMCTFVVRCKHVGRLPAGKDAFQGDNRSDFDLLPHTDVRCHALVYQALFFHFSSLHFPCLHMF